MKVTQLADRFGSNRSNAAEPGKLLRGCTCIAVPFAGGLCEVPHFTSNIVLVNDLDCAMMNLGVVVRDDWKRLQEKLDATLFHPKQLAESQAYCRAVEAKPLGDFRDDDLFHEAQTVVLPDPFEWAYHYFICSWLTRGGKGGTQGEFDAGLSIRYKSGGGDSVVRFRSATEGLEAWSKVVRRCTFTTLEAFEFLAECKKRDIPENGIYCDANWPDAGDDYKHRLFHAGQVKLRDVLMSFERSRIVVRYGDHPLIRELYSESEWTWHLLTGRNQANAAAAEVLLERVCDESPSR